MKEIVAGKLYQACAAETQGICDSNGKIARLGLKAVLTVADNAPVRVPATLVHLHLPIDELKPTATEYFKLACGLGIYPLLVHCQAGANRSRVFAAAIAHKAFELPLEEAIKIADPPPVGVVFDSMVNWAKGKP